EQGQGVRKLLQSPARWPLYHSGTPYSMPLFFFFKQKTAYEIGRATQVLNLPRPTAEVDIVLQYGKLGPNEAGLRWRHLQFIEPRSASIFLDRVRLKLDKNFHAHLPDVDWMHPHLVSAEMKFRDGV